MHKSAGKSQWIGLILIAVLVALANLNFVFENAVYTVYLFVLLALLVLGVLLLNYRVPLLYFLVFTVPLSVSYPVGESILNGPSELICAFLGLYMLMRYVAGYRFTAGLIRHPLSIILLLDLLWLLFTTATSQMPEVSFKRVIVRFVYLAVYYFMFAELFASANKSTGKLFIYYCLGLVLPILYYLVQHWQIGFAIQGSTHFSQPFYNDHTVYGAALVYFLPFLFFYTFTYIKAPLYRGFYLALIVLFLVAIFFSYSRAAWLSLFCALLVYLVFRWKISTRFILVTSFLSLVVLAFLSGSLIESFSRNRGQSHGKDVEQHFKSVTNISTDASNVERINRWKCAWRMFLDKPLTGFGPGTYQFFYGGFQVHSDVNDNSTYAGDKGHAHSEYLNALSETGLPGLILFVLGILFSSYTSVSILRRSDNKEDRGLAMVLFMGLITFYIHSFFNGFIESDKMAMPVFASMAALSVLSLKLKNQPGPSI
ncbi:MAG TPA: O-antigen ligase family protein [Bacteroidia bacterium]|nr:O-antigen ligase family protein [Bacteroidia bacterium]